MKDEAHSSDARLPADLVAAEWLVKHDRGFTAAEEDEFLQWMRTQPENAEWYARHRQTWTDFNLLVEWRSEHSARPNPDLLAPAARPARRGLAWIWPTVLGAAACLTLTLVFWPDQQRGDVAASNEIVTTAYEQRILEDGSVIDLNAGSRLVVNFSLEERRVSILRGEAQFTVTKNPSRPFVVRAAGVDVRAVGTAFNVRLDAESVEVLVTEGKVQLDHAPESMAALANGEASRAEGAAESAPEKRQELPALIAGQRAVVPMAVGAPAARVLAASVEAMGRALAWQPRLLDFSSTPFVEVVAEFNRRNRTPLIIGDEALKPIPIVASFRSDNIEGFVRLLEVTVKVRAERRGNTARLYCDRTPCRDRADNVSAKKAVFPSAAERF